MTALGVSLAAVVGLAKTLAPSIKAGVDAASAPAAVVGVAIALLLLLLETWAALLALTFLISTITLASGRATVLQGAVHLVLFATFLFLAVVP